MIFSYLNINSITNKLSDLQKVICDSVDILTIVETKIDYSIPTAQFRLANYHTPYLLDISNKSGGILVYIKSNIPTRQLNCGKSIQAVPFEINLRKEKWLVISIYRPHSQNSEFLLNTLTSIIDHFTKLFDNYIIMGDFNLKPSDTTLKHFLDSNGLYNLIKGHTYFKGKGSLIDLILTNRKFSFKNTQLFETGLSDHHHMVYIMLKTTFQKSEPKQLIYRDFKNFYFESFKNDLLENVVTCDRSHDDFDRKFTAVLNKHAPKKKKWLHGSQKPHINKTLRHEIMKRSKLKNIANKTKNTSDIMKYKKQRNYVVQLNKKAKLEYFNNIDSSQESKLFWVNCKPYFSNKHSKADTDIILHEKGDIIFKNKGIANTFNEYFGSIVESLDLNVWTESSCNVPPPYTSDDDIDNILIKFANHPSIKTIKQNFDITSKFSFQPVSVNDVKQVIKDLKSKKSVGEDIPTNILKECDFTFSTLAGCINKSFENGAFPDCLKEANVTPIFKKDDPLDK